MLRLQEKLSSKHMCSKAMNTLGMTSTKVAVLHYLLGIYTKETKKQLAPSVFHQHPWIRAWLGVHWLRHLDMILKPGSFMVSSLQQATCIWTDHLCTNLEKRANNSNCLQIMSQCFMSLQFNFCLPWAVCILTSLNGPRTCSPAMLSSQQGT
jgi:hypothetical protein